MEKHLLVSLSNPVQGREDDYNDWFDKHHLPELLDIPGFVAGQRFTLSEAQRAPAPYPFKYMAIYEIETDDIAKTIGEIGAWQKDMTKTDTSDLARRALLVVRPLGPRIEKAR